jgi:hypothetical protein
MKITLESTTKIVTIDGVPARVWEGLTEGGVRVVAFIPRVAVREADDSSEFDRDLQRTGHLKPSPDVAAIPTRLVM